MTYQIWLGHFFGTPCNVANSSYWFYRKLYSLNYSPWQPHFVFLCRYAYKLSKLGSYIFILVLPGNSFDICLLFLTDFVGQHLKSFFIWGECNILNSLVILSNKQRKYKQLLLISVSLLLLFTSRESPRRSLKPGQ